MGDRMRIAVAGVGSGGRESALAWSCRQAGHDVVDVRDGLTYTPGPDVDLVIVGPEAALASGIADRCAAAGVACFGPTAELARLETSKGFTRTLAAQLELPSPQFFRTDSAHDAIKWWRNLGTRVVVKLDGLASGKGVVVPNNPAETEQAIRGLSAQGPIVVEERLVGPECTLMALCDGTTARALPLAQDHKRIGEGDAGPNTGGMGAYAPAPVPYDAAQLTKTFVQPVLDHLAAQGKRYVGVLYAGLILTPDGPRLLEFNCRFGDPEAQAVIPLLPIDIGTLAKACCDGTLADVPDLSRPTLTACTVVAAPPGYPDAPVLGGVISGIDDDPARGDALPAALTFVGGVTRDPSGALVVGGGRTLSVTGLGPDLATARDRAYERMAGIHFDGMQVRRDIGWRSIGATLGSYAAAGVNIDEGNRAVATMKAAVEATHTDAVMRGVGSFGGVFSARSLQQMDDPLLVASTDGVGTKVELAARLGRPRGVGVDIVNHCIDDVLVQGARPLFFLDYIAAGTLDAAQVAEVVTGMAQACAAAGCVLLGGETAEMPGVYAEGAFDIAGTLVGAVDRADLLPRPDVAAGDVLIGLASSGPHTNGYSLLRRLFAWVPMDATPAGFTRTLGETLLEPHRSYLDVLSPVLAARTVKALAHITGGGLPENLPRALPADCDAVVRVGSWPVPPLFQLVREVASAMDLHELYRSLNMGIGMVAICAADDVAAVQAAIPETTWVIGEVVPGTGTVRLA